MQTSDVRRPASQFRLHPCYHAEDLSQKSEGWPATYVHHFFPATSNPKLILNADFRVHIFFCVTTFDVFVEVEGEVDPLLLRGETEIKSVSPPARDVPQEAVIQSLESTETFPGGFIRDKDAFIERLPGVRQASRHETDDQPQKKKYKQGGVNLQGTIKLPGRTVGTLEDVPFNDLIPNDRVWLVECSFGTQEEDPAAVLLHRRIEWLMHFFIDALSPIHLDSRWRVFLPIRYLCPAEEDPLVQCLLANPAKPNTKIFEAIQNLQGNIRCLLSDTGGKSLDLNNAVTRLIGQEATSEPRKADLVLPEDPVACLPRSDSMDGILRDGVGCFETLGLVTVYQFFSLPKDRARISQFFVLPHRQRLGLGRQLLACLHELLIKDPMIRQVTVEDPAPGFQRLRDVVSMDMALRHQIFSIDAIHEGEGQCPADDWPQYSQLLKVVLKEAPSQRRRMRLLVQIGMKIPDAVLFGGPERVQEWQLTSLTEVRKQEKRRLRIESLEWYSQQRTLAEIQAALEKEWQSLLSANVSALKTLRHIYPKP